MSYDLFFAADQAVPSLDALRSHFEQRAHWTLTETQALYENPTSGVHFSVEFREPAPGEVPMAFNVNYARPEIFAREADEELSALVQRFALTVDDPQRDGMGVGPYSSEGFLRGWNAGNRFAARVHLERAEPHSTPSAPEATNTGVWRWNRMRESYLDLLGSLEMLPCFVPTIMLMARKASPHDVFTAAVWTEAMAVALPEVDFILSLRTGTKVPFLIPYGLVRPHLESLPTREATHTFTLDERVHITGMRHTMVEEDVAEGPLRALLLTSGEPNPPLVRLPPHAVWDAEVLAAAREA